jgi:hypothetical protein
MGFSHPSFSIKRMLIRRSVLKIEALAKVLTTEVTEKVNENTERKIIFKINKLLRELIFLPLCVLSGLNSFAKGPIVKRYLIIVLGLPFLFSCASVQQAPAPPERVSSLALADISQGLPRDGQWRENIALADMNGDGFLDIVAPPPRRAEEGKNRPAIFLWDQQERGWKEGAFAFPLLKGYGYGGIAVGDINGDGYPDIVLAVHEGKIILLENNRGNGFVERPFPVKGTFHSRTVEVNDINRDGRPDIIALSEAAFDPAQSRKLKGILIGVNKESGNWDVKTVEGSEQLFGDSLAIGDIKGGGNKDIVIAPLLSTKEKARPVWFGDGKGNFSAYDGDLTGENMMALSVRLGDLDGDGKDEVVFRVSGFGQDAKTFLSAYKWTGAGFADISKGLEMIEGPIVFDLLDVDGDGKKELIVLSTKGIEIYAYIDKGWVERGYYRLPYEETIGAYDLRAGRNKDGSLLIAYNLARTEQAFNRGIRAFLLK